MQQILVTGGAGYIGSHTCRQLIEAGYRPVILDSLNTGSRDALPADMPFYQGDVGDRALLDQIFREHSITGVLHFAAHIAVDESVARPAEYYRNNVTHSATLIEACAGHGIGRFIFSSSAAVYGAPATLPVDEDSPTVPINPYGRTKLITEWFLEDRARAGPENLHYVALRYFNVAGAADDGGLGQRGAKATHLIKVACQAACGKREALHVFGTDYPTIDGTCIRDYIHVEDLAAAHVAALAYLEAGGDNQILNCGYGHGYSVRQVIDRVREVSGKPFKVIESPRRAGDPPELVADNRRIRRVLNWKPERDDLSLICRSAYEWERKA